MELFCNVINISTFSFSTERSLFPVRATAFDSFVTVARAPENRDFRENFEAILQKNAVFFEAILQKKYVFKYLVNFFEH